MWIEYSKQGMNNPCSEMQLEEDKIHTTSVVKPLENNNGAQEEEEVSKSFFLEGAKDPRERNPKLQINLNKTNKAISVFPQGRDTLQRTRRWHFTRGTSPIICTSMETTDSTSMASLSDYSRLPTSMESDTSPMEIRANKVHTRIDSSGRSSTEVSQFMDCRKVTFSRQKLPIELFYCPRTNQTQTNLRLYRIESVHTMLLFQDVRSSSTKRDHRERRLHMQDRFGGCACSVVEQ